MKHLKIKFFLVAIMVIAMTNVNYAQDQKQMNKEMRSIEMAKRQSDNTLPILKNIQNLTPEQETKILTLHKTMQKQMLAMRNELKEKQARLNTMQAAEKSDMKAINTLIDEIYTIKAKIAKIHAQFRQDVRATLTDDQRLDFDLKGCKMKNGKGQNNCPRK